jgi:transaldolase
MDRSRCIDCADGCRHGHHADGWGLRGDGGRHVPLPLAHTLLDESTTNMKTTALNQLHPLGQSIWMDCIGRDLISSGKLRRLIDEDGLRGMTSNPSIFEKAIVDSHAYDDDIRAMVLQGKEAEAIYASLSQSDVQRAADEFRPLYDASHGKDGYVSLEVNPHLAHDTDGTLKEARQLWEALDRPNILIKVPATQDGLPAIRQLLSEGINVNVTLLFGLSRYRQVVEAFIGGLEARVGRGQSVRHLASVASFFVSRIDTMVDPLLDAIVEQGGQQAELAQLVRGQIAIASAKRAYQIYNETVSSERFQGLANRGARSQRLLWASTGTKNSAYSDVKYIEALIGPETVNTAPLETIDAYRDHGAPKSRLELDVREASWIMDQLPKLGIAIDDVTRRLEEEGVMKFDEPFDLLLKTLGHAPST